MSSKVAFCRLALLLAALTLLVAPALAHFIPRDITVLGFVKPEGQTLKVLLRVPVKGIEDVEVPNRNMSTLSGSIRPWRTPRASSWSTI